MSDSAIYIKTFPDVKLKCHKKQCYQHVFCVASWEGIEYMIWLSSVSICFGYGADPYRWSKPKVFIFLCTALFGLVILTMKAFIFPTRKSYEIEG